jgi:hypothetical protein
MNHNTEQYISLVQSVTHNYIFSIVNNIWNTKTSALTSNHTNNIQKGKPENLHISACPRMLLVYINDHFAN